MALYSSRLPALNGIALCAGYGGLELGLHIAEPRYRTVCFVEREAHAAAAIVARMEDKALDHAPIWDDVKSFDGRPWRDRVHILTAGYPCQPFSTAGRRKGTKDPRHLWPDVARIIGEAEPEWVFLENVVGHLDLGFSEVGRGLCGMGYKVKAGLFSAAEAGASHWRQRLFVLAHADGGCGRQQGRVPRGREGTDARSLPRSGRLTSGPRHGCADVDADVASHADRRGGAKSGEANELPLFAPAPGDLGAWHKSLKRDPSRQPAFWGMADGMAERVDELRGVGNGVCSMAAALAYRTLKADFGV